MFVQFNPESNLVRSPPGGLMLRQPARRWSAILYAAALGISVALVTHGCTGGDRYDPMSPELGQVKLRRTLTLQGSGGGSGVIKAEAIEVADLVCTITNGSWLPEQCIKDYGWKTVVTITAIPATGGRFTGWSGSCSGTATTCKVTMVQSRTVTAGFAGSGVLSYELTIVGGGTGSGTVTIQPPAPQSAIVCTITSGTASGTGCKPNFPSGTAVSLTAHATVGTFNQWGGDCASAGTGTCNLTMSAARTVSASFTAPAGVEATVGKWDPPGSTPVIAVHLIKLLNGKLLLAGHIGEPYTWDPATGQFEMKADPFCQHPDCDPWCGGHTFLKNGTLMWAGGHNEGLGGTTGVKNAATFDGNGWSPLPPMLYGRWYPTLVTLANGDVVAISGNIDGTTRALIPERYNAAANTWTALTGASSDTWLYPRMFVEPKNGWIFRAGEQASRYLDPTGTGALFTTGLANPNRTVLDRGYGSAVMLDTKVLYVGGGGATCPNPVQNTAEIIDLAAATPTWTPTASMAYARRQMNAQILPDGTVLAIGGTSACGGNDESGSVYAAELYTPQSGSTAANWRTLSNATKLRVYHSTSALLADGRVMVSGSGDGGAGTQQFNYEIFSPPYLFKGARPTYTLGSTNLHYGVSFVVSTPDATSITKVTIIRLTSTTHAFDQGQRLNTLSFTKAVDGLSLTVTPPASGKLAPPGPYMLFLVNGNGVPSVGQTILLQ